MKAQLEKITSPPQGSFNAFRYQHKVFDAPWHFHPEFELTYIVKSSGIRYVGDSVMDFEMGDLVLLGANLPHCWKNTEDQNEHSESIVLQWGETILGEGWLLKGEFTSIRALLINASRGIKFQPIVAQEIAPMLDDLLKMNPFGKMISLLKILDKLSHSRNPILLSGDNFTIKPDHVANQKIDIIQNYVREHYQKRISLREVSELVTMSEETFCRFFKRTFNKSFFAFLNEYKIKLACKHLIESNKQVSEIAFLCGYESLPFFYRQFKKFTGCSPLVYQKKYARAFRE